MKLYSDSRAPNPRRVRMFLAEKGISDVEIVEISINDRETETSEFREKNPLGWLPLLELDDGTIIAESMAICRYFDGLQPEPALFGTGALGTAVVEQWNRHMEHEILLLATHAFRNSHSFWEGRIDQAPEFGELSKGRLSERFDWLDRVLAERTWIAGDDFSVADITALAGIDFGRLSKVRIGDDRLNLARWYAAMGERPSSKA